MKHLIPVVFLLLLSCKQELPDIPKDVIPMKEMTQILTDIHITDAVAETKAQAGADERTLTVSYNEQIFKNHGITREKFTRSFNFYENNPKLMNKMYDEVLIEMSKREASLSKQ